MAPATVAEEMFHSSALAPAMPATLRRLGDLGATTLAVMHGSSFSGDGKRAFYDLAAEYEKVVVNAESAVATAAGHPPPECSGNK